MPKYKLNYNGVFRTQHAYILEADENVCCQGAKFCAKLYEVVCRVRKEPGDLKIIATSNQIYNINAESGLFQHPQTVILEFKG